MFPQTRIVVLGFLLVCLLTSFGLVCHAADGEPALERGFRQPPDQTKPWVYWYWISDNISKEGITRDLEAMAGLGLARRLSATFSWRTSRWRCQGAEPSRGGNWWNTRFVRPDAWE